MAAETLLPSSRPGHAARAVARVLDSFSANRGAVAAWSSSSCAAAGGVRALDRAARAGRDQQRGLPEAAGLAGRRLVAVILLGTDAIGRDILSRLIYGARLSLSIGIAVVALAMAPGIALGLIAGFARGITEIFIMRLMDIILTLPSLLLAIVIVAILGPGLMNAMLAVAIVVLPHYVRITRAAVITETSHATT
jgi:ABC-type dipeptide/oligopeptide/nickel transport system permease subunit